MSFVHLHLHSEYSLLDGASRIKEIPKTAKANGQNAVAITDHGVMYGTFAFFEACRAEGIKPIIGCECYYTDSSRLEKNPAEKRYHLILLCKDDEGYKNLSKMVSLAFTEGFYSKPRIDAELLRKYSKGLVCLTGCLSGKIPTELLAGNITAAEKHLEFLKSLFGDDLYIEIQDHGLAEEKELLPKLIELSEKHEVPLAATNDVHYLKKSDASTQNVLMCISTNTVYGSKEAMSFGADEFYMKNEREMRYIFPKYPEAIDNTQKIADKCNFEFKTDRIIPPALPRELCKDPKEELREKVYQGFSESIASGRIRFDKNSEDEYRDRIEHELSVIDSMGYNDYFLIVGDYVNYAKKKGISVGPGRGSGAGSLCVYLLNITDADPLRYDLLFERFLNPERVSMPDIDVDFCYIRRDEVVNYVIERYGRENVAQIITFGTLAAKAAIRDVGRALDYPYAEVDTIAKLVPNAIGITLKDAMEKGELRRLYDEDERVKRLLDIAMAIEGMPRNVSVHAAGVLISSTPVSDYMPLSKSGDVVVTQFDMDAVSKLGLLKYDFLALRYLTIIADAEKVIRAHTPDFDIERVPEDDSEAYRLLGSGNTLGIFQLESPGMRRMLEKFSPRNIDDITAAISLYRPGPMDSIPEYINGRRHPESIKYPFESLKDILEPTHGVMVYQEQVMSVLRTVGGYSLGRADIVRRAMSKKKLSVIEAEREIFLKGAEERGYDLTVARELFDKIEAFANYAFNKSHAVAYAIIAYRTAYLKANYPGEFCAALLTSVLSSPQKVAEYTQDFSAYGIKLLPPDINESMMDFSVSGKEIRFGLMAIRAVGRQPAVAVIEERARGRFKSFVDFVERMPKNILNKRTVEALIKAGCFDSLGVERSRLAVRYEEIIDQITGERSGGVEGQLDLFSGFAGGEKSFEVKYPPIPEYDTRTKLSLEKEYLGLCISGHLTDDYKKHMDSISHVSAGSFSPGSDDEEQNAERPRDGSRVTVCGVISSITLKSTKSGKVMAFLKLEDETGEVECIAFEGVYDMYLDLLAQDSAIAVSGRVSERNEKYSVIAANIIPLVENGSFREESAPKIPQREAAVRTKSESSVKTEKPTKVYVRVESLESPIAERIKAISELCRGECELYFYDMKEKSYAKLSTGISPSPYILSLLEKILPKGDLVVK